MTRRWNRMALGAGTAALVLVGSLFGVGVLLGPAHTGKTAAAAPVAVAPPPTPPAGWLPSGREDHAEIKLVASRFVEQLGSWGPGDPRDPVARTTAAGYPAELSELATPLTAVVAPSAVTTVRYPQLGGLTDTTASVIVVARQQLGTDPVTDRDVTIDVRAVREETGWRVSGVADPARPEPVPAQAGGPSDVGRAVLDSSVELPGPARTDITERRLSDGILAVLAALSREYTLQVQVAVTGHPGTVFPRNHVSNHAVGRAVDIRAIDGRAVIDIPSDDPLLTEVMIAAARAGATEVGGPVPVAGPGFFTDVVHQDHLHLGISTGKPPARPD